MLVTAKSFLLLIAIMQVLFISHAFRLPTTTHHNTLWSSSTARFLSSTPATDTSALKKLREISGAPMMDCKNALQAPEVGGDIEKAVAWLRTKGLAKVAKSTRVTKEGLIGMHVSDDETTVALVEVNCETDFVKRNKDFQSFVALLAATVSRHAGSQHRDHIELSEILAYKPVSEEATQNNGESKVYATVEEALGDVVSSIRETIVIRRVALISAHHNNHNNHDQQDNNDKKKVLLATYMHNKVGGVLNEKTQLGKFAAVVSLNVQQKENKVNAEVEHALKHETGRRLAMHVVAAQPLFLDASLASAEFVEAETKIFLEQLKEQENANSNSNNKGKNEEVVKKIIDGKVNKRLAEVCLLQQNHQAEEGNPVVKKHFEQLSQQLQCDVSVANFALWSLNN